MDEEKRQRFIKTVVMLVILAVVILGVYLIIVVRGPRDNTTREDQALSAVEQITTLDLEKSYPPTPGEVVDLYARIMKVMYRQDYTDKQFNLMVAKLEGIFDMELLQNQVNWPLSLKNEVRYKKEGDYSIVNYSVDTADKVVTSVVDGKEIANLSCIYAMRHGTSTEPQQFVYVLRKDEDGRWKILGWEEK